MQLLRELAVISLFSRKIHSHNEHSLIIIKPIWMRIQPIQTGIQPLFTLIQPNFRLIQPNQPRIQPISPKTKDTTLVASLVFSLKSFQLFS